MGHAQEALDTVCAKWRLPDSGIWETRDAPRHFVYSQGMCWIALERGIEIAEKLQEGGADELAAAIGADQSANSSGGHTASRQHSYVQAYGAMPGCLGAAPGHAGSVDLHSTRDAMHAWGDPAGADGGRVRAAQQEPRCGRGGGRSFSAVQFLVLRQPGARGAGEGRAPTFSKGCSGAAMIWGCSRRSSIRRTRRNWGTFRRRSRHVG